MIDWNRIEHVLLDMDGTLLDLRFDNDFWLCQVPRAYARQWGISEEEAKNTLFPRMMELRGSLEWYSVDFWSRETGVDIVALKRRFRHNIRLRDGVHGFLRAVQASGRPLVLVTNAHPATLEIKFAEAEIGSYFSHQITSHDYGAPKEDQAFWQRLCSDLELDPARCLFIDDSDAVLQAAAEFGIGQILHVARPDSALAPVYHRDFPNLENYAQLLPVPGLA